MNKFPSNICISLIIIEGKKIGRLQHYFYASHCFNAKQFSKIETSCFLLNQIKFKMIDFHLKGYIKKSSRFS